MMIFTFYFLLVFGSLLAFEITSPTSGVVVVGTLLQLTATCASPRFYSSLQGELGNGNVLLASGVHYLWAVDEINGDLSSSNVTLLVRPPQPDIKEYLETIARIELYQSAEPKEWLKFFAEVVPDDIYTFASGGDEQNFPSRVNAAIGNTRTTVGLTRSGGITTLRSAPASLDSIDYVELNNQTLKTFGAEVAVLLDDASLVWLRDTKIFNLQRQKYASDDSNVVFNYFHSSQLDLIIEQVSFVPPSLDVVVRRFVVVNATRNVRFLSYQNLAPCTSAFPGLPVSDWLFDYFNDYAAIVDVLHNSSALHYRPQTLELDYDALFEFANTSNGPRNFNSSLEVAKFIQSSVESIKSGEFWASTCDDGGCASTTTATVGGTASDPPRLAPTSLATFIRAAVIHVSSTFNSATFLLASGTTRALANKQLQLALDKGYTQLLSETEKYWSNFINSGCRMPRINDYIAIAFSKRALISLRMATAAAAAGGEGSKEVAIVASIDNLTPYGYDWPRDGAFLNECLYESNSSDALEVADAHNRFYARVQRSRGLFSGTFANNFYGNGDPGGPIPLELDETGLALWAMARHVDKVVDEKRRAAYVADVWPAIERSANFCVLWRDEKNNLPLPANEDDSFALTQHIQNAVAVALGLRTAADVGSRHALSPPALLNKWSNRFNQLQKAILKQFYNATSKTYGFKIGKNGSFRGASWFLWPAELVELNSTAALNQAMALWNSYVKGTFENPGFYGYAAEDLLSIVRVYKAHGRSLEEFKRAYLTIVRDVATADTHHLGEFYFAFRSSNSSKLVYKNSNDIPQNYEQTTTYLLGLLLYDDK